jgi:hypothetical protein
MANPNPFSVVMRRKLDGQGKRDTVMATPEDVDKKIDSQDDSTQVPLVIPSHSICWNQIG